MTVSKYIEVANALADAINAGTYRERDALPPERTLSEDFEVSRDTMRKAIRALESQGYVVPRQGRGTFVAPDALRGMQRSIDGLSDEARRNRRAADQEILSITVVAAPVFVAKSLDLSSGTQVVRIHRIRKLDGTAIGVHDSYVLVDRPARLTAQRLREAGSLYRLLRDDFGLVLTDAAESISAVSATGDEAGWLNLPPGAPLLCIERITISDDLHPVEFCVMKYAQSYKYDTVVRRRYLNN